MSQLYLTGRRLTINFTENIIKDKTRIITKNSALPTPYINIDVFIIYKLPLRMLKFSLCLLYCKTSLYAFV
jgi:hypothetical protein